MILPALAMLAFLIPNELSPACLCIHYNLVSSLVIASTVCTLWQSVIYQITTPLNLLSPFISASLWMQRSKVRGLSLQINSPISTHSITILFRKENFCQVRVPGCQPLHYSKHEAYPCLLHTVSRYLKFF